MSLRSIPAVIHQACCLFILLAALWPDPTRARESVARKWTPPEISTAQYESSPTFTPDGREMFFMLSDTRFSRYRIMWSRCENGAWTAPAAPAFAAPPSVLEADPFVTADGKRLYFVSSRHDKTGEDLDIWYVDRNTEGRWGRPQRLPEPVNSTSSELLPRAAADGRIYFGSSREGGFGKNDIYIATPAGDGSWRVSNFGAPVSTSADEYEAEISRDGRTLIVVADRGDRSHLYRFALQQGRWVEQGRIPAAPHVFQVGPLLSPSADKLLFAQDDGERSGEIFEIDLASDAAAAKPVSDWPAHCE